jgi:hypothetical protein
MLKNLLQWYDQEKFLGTLSNPKRPDFDQLDFPAKERDNVYTLWYAVQLIKSSLPCSLGHLSSRNPTVLHGRL